MIEVFAIREFFGGPDCYRREYPTPDAFCEPVISYAIDDA